MRDDDENRLRPAGGTLGGVDGHGGISLPDGATVEQEKPVANPVLMIRERWSDKAKHATLWTTLVVKTVYRGNQPEESDGVVRFSITETRERKFEAGYAAMREVAKALCETIRQVQAGTVRATSGKTLSITLPITSGLSVGLRSPGENWLNSPVLIELFLVVGRHEYTVSNPSVLIEGYADMFHSGQSRLTEDPVGMAFRLFERNSARGLP